MRDTGLSGIYSDPRHVIHYTSNDEVRREFGIVLTARPVNGHPAPSVEAEEVRWVQPADLADYSWGVRCRLGMLRRLAQAVGLAYREDDSWRPVGSKRPPRAAPNPGIVDRRRQRAGSQPAAGGYEDA